MSERQRHYYKPKKCIMNKDALIYDDIIDLPHHVSRRHRQMSMLNRASQFAPFAALSGYEDNIEKASETLVAETQYCSFSFGNDCDFTSDIYWRTAFEISSPIVPYKRK